MSKQAGHDLNYISVSGAAWYASDAGSPPFTPPTLVGDIGGGALYLVIGIISGVLNARTTGKGCVVDAAIYDGSAHMMNLLMTLRQSGGFVDKRNASILDGSHWSRAYLTSDCGYMSVQCLEPKFYAEFLSCMGQSDNPALADQYDQAQWPEQTRIISDIFKSRTRSEWEQVFEGTDACTAPVLSPEQASKHPMNDARQVWLTEGDTLQAASAPRFSGTPVKAAPSIPERGEHTIEILAELGM
jgi:crotonobetainyl-CoA:carnitine CoA-transferase CaiB-like acyl-CoA transferase